MKKYGGHVCERCRVIIQPTKLKTIRGKRRMLHYCSDYCVGVHRNNSKKGQKTTDQEKVLDEV